MSRSEARVEYDADTQQFKATEATAQEEESSTSWATTHAQQAAKTLNSLIDDYGFKPNKQAIEVILRDSGTLVNNPNYVNQGNKASLSSQQLMYTMIKQGGLAVDEMTDNNITSSPQTFADFVIKTANDMQDEIAAASYQLPTQVFDQTFYGIDSRRGNNNNYTPFANERIAYQFAENNRKVVQEVINDEPVEVETGFNVMQDNTLRYYRKVLNKAASNESQ